MDVIVERVRANSPNTCTEHGTDACTSECDCDFRPQNKNMTQKVQAQAPYRNCESGYSSMKQSSRYVTHNVAYTDMAWTRSASPIWESNDKN